MPERPFARCIGCWIHHSGDILAICLEQGVNAKWSCIDSLERPSEQLTEQRPATRLVKSDQFVPDKRALICHRSSPSLQVDVNFIQTHHAHCCEMSIASSCWLLVAQCSPNMNFHNKIPLCAQLAAMVTCGMDCLGRGRSDCEHRRRHD